MLDAAGIGHDPDALRGAVERLAEETERLREIERTFNEGWMPDIPGEPATLKLRALYRLRDLIPGEAR